ncbi:MAG: DUF4198 domain-containing protein [Phycisphaerales bacterium]
MVDRVVGVATVCGMLGGMCSVAGAHEFWVQPDRFRVGVGGLVRVELHHGERFAGEVVPRDDTMIERFELVAGDVATPVRGLHAMDQGFLRPASAGGATIVYETREFVNVLPADRFEAYLAEEGLEEISRRRADLGETGAIGREAYVRCAKALVTVEERGDDAGGAAASDGRAEATVAVPHDAPIGLPCEIVLLSCETANGGVAIRAEVLFEGEALGGVRVVAVAASAHEELIELETDEHGQVEFVAERGGPWLLTTLHMTRTDDRDDVDWKSYWASVAFEL